VVSLKIRRGKDEIDLPNLTLSGDVTAFLNPYLGVLPVRDDPDPGEEVRYVFPQSPAEAAGLKPGDRIVGIRLGGSETPPIPFSGRDELTKALDGLAPGVELKLQVERKEGKKSETLTLRLGTLPDTVPNALPEPASRKKALAPRQRVRPVPPGL